MILFLNHQHVSSKIFRRQQLKHFGCTRIVLYLLLVLYFMFALTGCAHHRYALSQDGPPKFDVDVSKIHDAVPKVEPRSTSGNPSSYVVYGRRYYVMSSSKGYSAKGLASWYGMKFHRHRTSSGELYDIAGMTAAHKTLPLPTYVRVTNLRNGRHVIVKVNDRGPFRSNRIMDLSYAAAKKLGVTGMGTALVSIQAIDPRHFTPAVATPPTPARTPTVVAAQSSPPVKIANDPHRLFLQLASFSSKEHAEALMRQAKQWTDLPLGIKEQTFNQQTVYCVRVGPVKENSRLDVLYARTNLAGLSQPILKME